MKEIDFAPGCVECGDMKIEVLLFLVVFFWVVPMVAFPLGARESGKDARWAFFWSFLFGWLGGGFALLLLKVTPEGLADIAQRKRAKEASEKAADARYLAAKESQRRSALSEADYDRLVGGKRR